MKTSTDPLQYCDVCFHGVMPNLTETYKGVFTKTCPINFLQQRKLDKILSDLNLRPNLVERRWTCILDRIQRRNFLDMLWGTGITVHTLQDHVKVLQKLYRPDVIKLGSVEEIEIRTNEPWEWFDPNCRQWLQLDVIKKQGKFFVNIKRGAVLKSGSGENSSYYRIVTTNGKFEITKMEKRAAFNIITTQVDQAKANWHYDEVSEMGFIMKNFLKNIPEEISNAIQRLESVQKIAEDFSAFDIEDIELVKNILSFAKIDLVKSNEKLSFKKDLKEPEITPINDVKSRISSFIEMISELGGKIESSDDKITITGKVNSMMIAFISGQKSRQDGKTFFVPSSALEEPNRTNDLLLMIKKQVGLLGMNIENLVCQKWPIITDVDMQYVLQYVIECWKMDTKLALNMLQDKKKLEQITQWNNKVKTGKIRSNLDTITLGKILKQAG